MCHVLLAAVYSGEQNGLNQMYYFRALSSEIIIRHTAVRYLFQTYAHTFFSVHKLPGIPNSSGRRVIIVSRISACSSGVSSRCVPFWNPRFFGSRELSPSRRYAVHISLARFCRTPVNSSISFPVLPNSLSRTTCRRICLSSPLFSFRKSIYSMLSILPLPISFS